jgi:glycosyltransferase involved in cell wall biosynthesis
MLHGMTDDSNYRYDRLTSGEPKSVNQNSTVLYKRRTGEGLSLAFIGESVNVDQIAQFAARNPTGPISSELLACYALPPTVSICSVPLRNGSSLMTLAHRVGPLLGLIAPPGSARRLLLRFGYRAARSLPKLMHPRYASAQLARLRDLVSFWPASVRHRGPLHRDRMGTAAGYRTQRVLNSIARARQHASGQVLVIDHRIPTPNRDSGSFRMMEIIRAIKRRGHHVALIPDNMAVFSPYLEDLLRERIEVIYPPRFHSVEDYLVKRGHELNLVIISRADVAARHMQSVRRHSPGARIVFDTVDLHFVREERQACLGASPEVRASAASRKQQELGLARMADLTLVVSSIEKAVLENEFNHRIDVRVLSNIHPVKQQARPVFEQRRDIVFIGGFDHAPNIDAVLYFAAEIFPRVLSRVPGVVFQVIGPDPTPEIRRLASPFLNILGFVADVEPIFDRARVSVAPLRFGAGVKGKVNQSMSFGVPSVVTSIAAEGMYLTHGENAMIADQPESFADAVVRLLTSPELWHKVSKNGVKNVADHFSIDAAAKSIDELLDWAGLPAN